MTVQTIATLKENMPLDVGGAISAQDLHDVVDTLEARTKQVVSVKTSNYTAVLDDNRTIIAFNSASSVTLTLPSDLPVGWECSVVQIGDGVVTVTCPSGNVLCRSGHTLTNGRYAMVWLYCLSNPATSPQVILSGDTALSQATSQAWTISTASLPSGLTVQPSARFVGSGATTALALDTTPTVASAEQLSVAVTNGSYDVVVTYDDATSQSFPKQVAEGGNGLTLRPEFMNGHRIKSISATATTPARYAFQGWSVPSYFEGNFTDGNRATALSRMKSAGANSITLITHHFVTQGGNGTIYSLPNTERDADLTSAIAAAKAQGMKVIYKPHIELSNGTLGFVDQNGNPGAWRGTLGIGGFPGTIAARQGFLTGNFRTWLIGRAAIAQSSGCDMFVIGSEYDTLDDSDFTASWQNVISGVRGAYTGPITYGSSVWRAAGVGFWADVNYIGLDWYEKLSNSANPTVYQATNAWLATPPVSPNVGSISIFQFMTNLNATHNKPIFLTEIGYASRVGTSTQPAFNGSGGVADNNEQATCFRAAMTSLGYRPSWLSGLSLWDWPFSMPVNTVDHTVYNKTSESVIAAYLGGPT